MTIIHNTLNIALSIIADDYDEYNDCAKYKYYRHMTTDINIANFRHTAHTYRRYSTRQPSKTVQILSLSVDLNIVEHCWMPTIDRTQLIFSYEAKCRKDRITSLRHISNDIAIDAIDTLMSPIVVSRAINDYIDNTSYTNNSVMSVIGNNYNMIMRQINELLKKDKS